MQGGGGEGEENKRREASRAPGTDEQKVEFVKLVKPLMQTMKSDNVELAALATSALVNLCNYSADIK